MLKSLRYPPLFGLLQNLLIKLKCCTANNAMYIHSVYDNGSRLHYSIQWICISQYCLLLFFFLEERVLYIVDEILQKFHSKFLNPRSQWKNSWSISFPFFFFWSSTFDLKIGYGDDKISYWVNKNSEIWIKILNLNLAHINNKRDWDAGKFNNKNIFILQTNKGKDM